MSYESLAEQVVFLGFCHPEVHGLEYRKGKTIQDVIKARDKGFKAGRGKIEFELNMTEVYLKSVFKIKKEGNA